jgi:hypothetical protein
MIRCCKIFGKSKVRRLDGTMFCFSCLASDTEGGQSVCLENCGGLGDAVLADFKDVNSRRVEVWPRRHHKF